MFDFTQRNNLMEGKATFLHPLRSSDWLDLFVPHIRTSMAQLRSIHWSLSVEWTSPAVHSTILSGSLSSSFTSNPVFSPVAKHFWKTHAERSAT